MQDDGELERLRAVMDGLNRELAALLHARARLVRTIGALKRARGLPAVDPAREAAMLDAIGEHAPADGLPTAALRTVFRAVLAASRDIVTRAR